MSATYCSRCGALLRRAANGDVTCMNGHSPEHDGVASALIDLMPVLLELRGRLERIEEQGERTEQHTDALREQVSELAAAVTPSHEPAAYVGLGEMCRQLGVTRDWMYRDDRRRKLGGFQAAKGGRWRFDPERTRARYASLFGPRGEAPGAAPSLAAPSPARPRQLPAKVPLLPVKDHAA
jgi:hypothetical protein